MEKQDKIDQLVAENQELLALTKQAFVKREVALYGRSGLRRHPHCASFRWRRCKVPDPGGTNSKFVPTVPSIADRYRQDGHDNHNKAHCFRQCRIG